MNVDEFFKKLEKEFGITPYEYCKAKAISLRTLKRCIEGKKPSRHIAKNIEKFTKDALNKITLKDLGFED